ncbi:type IV pilus modification PilV family protein [Vreelandella sp. GE22]
MRAAFKCQRGFTLLEMLAAIVVLAIGSTVLLGAFGQSARSLYQVEQSDRAALAARSILDSIEGQVLEVGTHRGSWDGLDWELDVSLEAQGALDLYRLDLTLTQGARRSHYSTLRLRGSGATP